MGLVEKADWGRSRPESDQFGSGADMSGTEGKPEGIIGRLEAGGGFLGQLGLVFMVASVINSLVTMASSS